MRPPFRLGSDLLKKPALVDRIFRDVYEKIGNERTERVESVRVVSSQARLGYLSNEIENRALQDPLTHTSSTTSSGAQTTLNIDAYGGSETRIFNTNTLVIVDTITGEDHEVTVNDALHIGPAALSITINSYTFPRDLPSGCAIYLHPRHLMENALRGGGSADGAVDFNAGVFAKDGATKTFGIGTNEFVILGRRSHEYSFDPGPIAPGGTVSFTLQQTSTAHTSFYVEVVAVGRVGGSSGSTSAKKVSMSFALNSNSLFASGQQTEYEKGTGSPSLAFSVAAVGSSNQVTITMTNNHTTESFSGGVIHAKIVTSATALTLV